MYLTLNPNRQSTTVPTEGWFRLLPSKGLRPVLVSRDCGSFQQWAVHRQVPSYEDPLPFPNKWNPVPFCRSVFKLVRIVRKHHVDLIHCNEQDIYPIGQYVARLCRIPVFVSVHFTMGRGYCQWAFGGRKAPDRMFFLSQGSRGACLPGIQGVIPEDRWRLLYNGLDLDKFKPDQQRRSRFRLGRLDAQDIAIGVACAIRPRKQLEHLFKVAALVDDPRLKVIVAGAPVAGDAEYAEKLLDRARKALGERLVLLGHIDELRDFYNGLDVFVNTSQEEACSISVIESLACGCPVLGYASKSVDDQILPGGGEIVPQDDIESLAATLRNWVQDPEQLAQRRISARARAEEMFDIRKLSDQLWEEYCQVMSNRG